MRAYMDRRVTPPKRVTSPTWGPPTPCKQESRSRAVLRTTEGGEGGGGLDGIGDETNNSVSQKRNESNGTGFCFSS